MMRTRGALEAQPACGALLVALRMTTIYCGNGCAPGPHLCADHYILCPQMLRSTNSSVVQAAVKVCIGVCGPGDKARKPNSTAKNRTSTERRRGAQRKSRT